MRDHIGHAQIYVLKKMRMGRPWMPLALSKEGTLDLAEQIFQAFREESACDGARRWPHTKTQGLV